MPRGSQHAGHYYALMGFAGIAGLAKGFALSRVLGEEGFGYYALGMLVAAYGEYVLVPGIFRGLESSQPRLYGEGREVVAQWQRNLVGTVGLSSGVAATTALAIGSFVFSTSPIGSVFFLAGLVATTQLLLMIALQDLRSRLDLAGVALISVGKAVLALAACTAFGWFVGWEGAIIGEAIVAGGLFVVFARGRLLGFRFTLNGWRKLWEFFRLGFPLSMKFALNDLVIFLDRWWVLATLGIGALGQYTFGMLLFAAGLLAHNALWSHYGPRALYEFGPTKDVNSLSRKFDRLALITVAFGLLGWLPFVWSSQIVLSPLFPAFQEGIALLPILYLGVVFQLLSLHEWVVIALSRNSLLFVAAVISGAVVLATLFSSNNSATSLVTVAWAFVAGRAAWAGSVFVAARVAIARNANPVTP